MKFPAMTLSFLHFLMLMFILLTVRSRQILGIFLIHPKHRKSDLREILDEGKR